MDFLTAIIIGVLFAIGFFQLLRRNLIRSVIGFIILSNAINLLLLTVGAYQGIGPAYADVLDQHSDALPQALILTAIVISMGGMALVVAMLSVLVNRYKTTDTDQVKGLRR